MDITLKFAITMMMFLSLWLANASSSGGDFGQCKAIVERWSVNAHDSEQKYDRHTLQDLLFFLHVPRTGGRTYFHCFLKKLYSSYQECPRSYDKLRFDPSKPKCRLLVTHDDYSMMSKLPRKQTSVMTILRNPVDRIFSTYEFSIEVAARFLVHPNLTSATRIAGRLRAKTNGISTLDIWPWKYLVPWMREDLFARRDTRKQKDSDDILGNDSYSMEEVALPFQDFINDPIALDIVHNGATFQIAGLTNNSYLAESHEVRHCVQQHPILGKYILQVAKKRLDNMLYVGLTEDHRKSATMFANVVGAQVISQLEMSNYSMDRVADKKSAKHSSLRLGEVSLNDHDSSSTDHSESESSSSTDGDKERENMSVEKLMGAYEWCISDLRKTQSHRRSSSLKRISPIKFTKEGRLGVGESIVDEIRLLNNLDFELYKYGESIFRKQQEENKSPLEEEEEEEVMKKKKKMISVTEEGYEMMMMWQLGVGLFSIIVFCGIALYVNTTRTSSKVKM